MTTTTTSDVIETEDAFEAIGTKTEAPIIPGVKLLGLRSRNKKNYDTKGARESGIRLMEGVQVYIDHPDRIDKPRSYRDKFGHIKNVRYEPGKGHFGDLHYNPKHPSAEQFLWDVQNSPNTQGLSINAKAKFGRTDNAGDVIVESLEVVRSVDIVAKPATNSGIFESELPEEDETMDLKTLKEKHPELFKQVLEEVRDTDVTESELVTLRKQNADAMAQLAIFTKQEEARQLRVKVESEFTESFKDSAIPADMQKNILECACGCDTEPRGKLKGIVDSLNELLGAIPEEAPEGAPEEDPAPVAEQYEEKPTRPKAPYKPGKKGAAYDFMADMGLKGK